MALSLAWVRRRAAGRSVHADPVFPAVDRLERHLVALLVLVLNAVFGDGGFSQLRDSRTLFAQSSLGLGGFGLQAGEAA